MSDSGNETMKVEEAAIQVLNAWDEFQAEATYANLCGDVSLAGVDAQLAAVGEAIGVLARCLCAGHECADGDTIDACKSIELVAVRSFAHAALSAPDIRAHIVNQLAQLESLNDGVHHG